jgi:hypothetical protein
MALTPLPDHWIAGFNFNVEEWFQGDRHQTQAICRTLAMARDVFALVIKERPAGRLMIQPARNRVTPSVPRLPQPAFTSRQIRSAADDHGSAPDAVVAPAVNGSEPAPHPNRAVRADTSGAIDAPRADDRIGLVDICCQSNANQAKKHKGLYRPRFHLEMLSTGHPNLPTSRYCAQFVRYRFSLARSSE